MKIIDITDLKTDPEAYLEAYGSAGSRAMGGGNFADLANFYRGRKRTQNLKLDFGNNHMVELTDADVDALVKYYNDLEAMDDKRDFVYGIMARYDKFSALAKNLGITPIEPKMAVDTGEPQLGLFERDSKKKSDTLDKETIRDPKLAVAMRQAFSRYPTAASPIEAFIRQEIENQAKTDNNFSQQDKTNDRQDKVIDRLRDTARRQSQQLADLDNENDNLDNVVDNLNREISNLERQLGQVSQSKVQRKEKQTTKKATDEPLQGRGVVNKSAGPAAAPSKSLPAADKKPEKDSPASVDKQPDKKDYGSNVLPFPSIEKHVDRNEPDSQYELPLKIAAESKRSEISMRGLIDIVKSD